MKRFKKILFVNDGKSKKDAALERAVNLAKRNQALLTVVEVFEELTEETKASIKSKDIDGFEKIAILESTERLDSLIAPIREDGVEATSKVLQGTPFLEIIREVLRNSHDLVMLCPRKKAKLKEMLFGSRIMHLMRKCPCPVWAIKPTKRKEYARILAAVDPVFFDDERNALNVKIMELATSLAELVKKKEIELVVMGTVCRTGPSGFFIGNTAERVLQQIDCSILAVKPDGFVTPVRLNE